MILGGFLMLPATFIHDDELRVSKQVIGIFAVAILAGGFAFTGLLTFAVRDAEFHANTVYLQSLVSCAVGLLTVLYSLFINKRYYWNIPAYLSTAVAVIGILAYSGLVFYKSHRTGRVRPRRSMVPSSLPVQPEDSRSTETLVPRYQDTAFYDNYVQNMWPTSTRSPSHSPQPGGHTSEAISEEEMQRQQMLMLLNRETPSTTPDLSQSTFRIDWQGQDQDQDDRTPVSGYYEAGTQTSGSGSGSSGYPRSGISRKFSWQTQTMQPWDGVWRDPVPASMRAPGRAQMSGFDVREERRRQIESGR
ncbi:uncharacterized protein LTR77_010633 [Saxophila tyrrhenica]|uniref:Uncharacterized protein n=1 Tax=Saxophila tyrrhenica TaxID=1690608 RepID=A0AAV9NYK1_9PEZI|nr:hypothetical protein LTR77_010633 [Saxophila tyrrhenica]